MIINIIIIICINVIVTLCHLYSSSNMTLVIDVNISVWKRKTSECFTINIMNLHASNKYVYIGENTQSVLTTTIHDTRLSTTALRCYNSVNERLSNLFLLSSDDSTWPIYKYQCFRLELILILS